MLTTPFGPHVNLFDKLMIFGAGGFGREVAWLAEQIGWKIDQLGFLVDRPEFAVGAVNGFPVLLLGERERSSTTSEGYVVALGDPFARERCSKLCENTGFLAATLVHPRVEISRWVEIAPGSIVCAGTILTTNIQVGQHVHINLDCTIGHDVQIGDFTTLSPGVHVSGHVHIGRRVFIGTGAVIINGSSEKALTIGDDAVVAAGACVTKPVDAGALVAGVPAVRKR